MMRHLRLPAIALAIFGVVWVLADHVTNNMGTLEILGTLSIWLLIAGVIGAIAIGVFVLSRPRPSTPEFSTPPPATRAVRVSSGAGRSSPGDVHWRNALTSPMRPTASWTLHGAQSMIHSRRDLLRL